MTHHTDSDEIAVDAAEVDRFITEICGVNVNISDTWRMFARGALTMLLYRARGRERTRILEEINAAAEEERVKLEKLR